MPRPKKIYDMTKIESKDVKTLLNKRFIKTDEFAELLWVGFSTNKNIIFWGPGGHGKSEMAMEFFNGFNLPVFVQALGDGTTEDHLLGGLDMKAFKDEGKIEYLVENSFMAHEYVIFEELLDCPSQVLLRLKDILTSGYFRNGTQQYQIKTKFIVCLTNRSRDEVSDDRSVLALMERFPLELNVTWDSYEAKDYSMMFKKVLKKDHPVLAEAIAQCNKTSFISPRTAIHAAAVYETGGFSALRHIAGFNEGVVKNLQSREKEMLANAATTTKLNAALQYAQILQARQKECKTVTELLNLAYDMDYMASKFKLLTVSDSNVANLKALLTLLGDSAKTISNEALTKVTPNESSKKIIDKIYEDGILTESESEANKTS